VNKIETYPPVSRTVLGREIHFQLKAGRSPSCRWTSSPNCSSRCPTENRRLRSQAGIDETIGPLGGSWLRYTMERIDVPLPGGGVARGWPTASSCSISSDLGEKWEDALHSDSQFRAELAKARPGGTTVTL